MLFAVRPTLKYNSNRGLRTITQVYLSDLFEGKPFCFEYICSTFHNWSDPSTMSTTAPVEFDEGYNKQVIPLPVQLPRLFDYNSIHESRVTVEKLTELYQCMYSFIDGGDQNLVPTKVRLPILHNFNSYNEEFVTGVTLQAMYKCLYQIDKRAGAAGGASPTVGAGATG